MRALAECVIKLHAEHHALEDYQGGMPRWCSGCGDNAILSAMQRLCSEEGLQPENTVFVSGIGCSSRLPHYMKTYGFHGIHGRALPVATGIKLHRPDLTVFVVMGDGDCTSIGAGHWLHAIRYNMKMVVLLLDNAIYGLTKNQTSPTTPQGHATNTQPKGSFLPPLDEGSLLFMPSLPAGAGPGETQRVMATQNRAISDIPEVAGVMGKMGRAETSLDPAPIGMVETVVLLKPYREWPVEDLLLPAGGSERRPRTLAEVRAALAAASDVPGVAPSWLQPIETRVVMLSTGIKSLIALQVSGDDSEAIERFITAAEPVIQGTPGATDVQANRESGKPYAEIRLDRERLARFGLSIEQVMMAVESAIGGMPLTTSVEGNQRYGIRLRYLRERRDDPDELALLQVPVMSGGHGAVLLSSLVARPVIHTLRFTDQTPEAWRATQSLAIARNLTVLDAHTAELVLPAGEALPPGLDLISQRPHPDALTYTIGPMQIRSENGKRVGYVLLNVRDAGEVEVVTEANRRVQQALSDGRLSLPPGASLKWVGRYEQKQRADAILRWVIIASLGAMVLLIYLGTRNWVTTIIIVVGNLPVVIAGGLIGVWLADAQMTTAVMVGFIALLGTTFNDGILIGLYLDERFKAMPRTIAEVRRLTIEAGQRRIRPALMTNCTTMFSLIPILWSDGRGSEIMLPMALPIIGGMIIDMLSPFTVPCLYAWWWERKLETEAKPEA